jgi:hypothetical protein
MNCPYVDSITDAYLSGEIENPQWRTHIAGCAWCSSKLSEEADLDLLLKHALTEKPVQTQRLETRIRQSIDRSGVPARTPMLAFRYAAVSLVILAALSLATFGYAKSRIDRTALCVDAADDHREEVIDKAPRKWRIDPQQLQALSQKMTGDSGLAQRLALAGYQFTGARTCLLHGNRYMHLRFSNGANEISVFVRHRDEHPTWTARLLDPFASKSPQSEVIDGLNVASEQKAQLTLVVATPGSMWDSMSLLEEAAKEL